MSSFFIIKILFGEFCVVGPRFRERRCASHDGH